MVVTIRNWMRTHKSLTVVIGVCAGLHLLSAVAVGVLYPHIISPATDQLEYRTIALNLIDHGTFSIAPADEHNPDLMRTPGYPLFVASTYIFDRSGFITILLQQLMLGAMGTLLYFLLRHFSIRQKISLALVAVYLLEPQQWFYSLQTMTETLSSFLFIILLALGILESRMSALWRTFTFGTLLGVLLLVKPTLTILAPFLLVLLLFKGQTIRNGFIHVAVAGVIALAMLSPWLLRNYLLTDSPTLSVSPAYVVISGFATPEQNASVNGGETLYNARGEAAGYVVEGYTLRGYQHLMDVAGQVIHEHGIPALITGQILYVPTVWFSLSDMYRMLGNIAIPRFSHLFFGFGFLVGLAGMVCSVLGFVAMLHHSRFRLYAFIFFGMLAAVTFMNLRIAYARTLIPLYPLIMLAVGTSVSLLFAQRGSRADTPVS